MYCSQCGKQINETDKFCSSCGAPVPTQVLDSEPPGKHPEKRNGPSVKPLGTKWLKFWNYFILPVACVGKFVLLGLFIGVISVNTTANESIGLLLYISLAIILLPWAILECVTAIGMHHRKMWAWKTNWVIIVLVYLLNFMPSRYGTNEFIIRLILVSLIWPWPNYIYWKKRKNLFHAEKKESSATIEIFMVIGVVVLSVAIIGILLGRQMDTSTKDRAVAPAHEAGDGSNAQSRTNQPILQQDDYKAQIQKILREKPNNASAFAEVGDIYFDNRNFVEAIEYYKKAVAMEPNDVDSYNDLGLAYHYIGRSDEGLKYVEEGLLRNPLYQRLWLTKGFILAIKGNIPEARGAWKKAYSLDPVSEIGKMAANFLKQYK